jgi:hypothetical protein
MDGGVGVYCLASEDHEAVRFHGLEDLTHRDEIQLDRFEVLQTLCRHDELRDRRRDDLGGETIGEESILIESDRVGHQLAAGGALKELGARLRHVDANDLPITDMDIDGEDARPTLLKYAVRPFFEGYTASLSKDEARADDRMPG